MNAEQTTKTILRLKTYVELCERRIKGETNPNKREFFERDLKKTNAAISKLRGV